MGILHDDGRNVNVGLDRLVRKDAATVDVDLVANGNIVTQDGDVLETGPATNGAVPADDGGLDPGVVLDLGSTEKNASLEANTVTNNDIGTNGNVGADSAVLANLGSGVDHDIAAMDEGLGGRGEFLAALLSQ